MKKLNSLLLVSALGVSLFAGLASFTKKSTPQPVEAGESVPTKNITVTPNDLKNKGNWTVNDYANIDRSGTTNSGITFAAGFARWHDDGLRVGGGYSFTVSSTKYTFLKVVFDFYCGYNVDYTEAIADDNDGANIKSHKNSSTQGYWQEETGKNSVTAKVSGSFAMVEKMVITVIANTYKVTYDANGGSGETVDPTEWVEDTNATLIASTFTAPEGKVFSKWNTKADGKGTSYNVGAKVKMTGNLTLYAQYANIITYSVDTYSGGYDGEAHSASISVSNPAEGAVIKYGTSESSITSNTCPEFNEVGEHTVWYKISASGYADVVSSFVINITENDKTVLNKAIESGNKVHELIKDKYTELDAALVTALEEGVTCKEDAHALPSEIIEKADAINAAVVKAVEAVVNDIGEVKANDEQSKQKVENARQVYDSLSDEQKALVPAHTLSTLEAAEKAVNSQGLGAGAIIGIVLGCLVVVLAVVYVLAFFVFHRWINKDGKAVRVARLWKCKDKILVMEMLFKFHKKDPSEIYKSKEDALK